MNRLRSLIARVRGLRRQITARLRCSFCGKRADEVGRLVAGPSVYICDECIKACVAVCSNTAAFRPPTRIG